VHIQSTTKQTKEETKCERFAPFRNKFSKNCTQPVRKIAGSEERLVIRIQAAPWLGGIKEFIFVVACSCPVNPFFEHMRTWLFHAVPVVKQWFFLVANEAKP